MGREKHCKEWNAWCSVREPQDRWDKLHASKTQKWQPHHGRYLEGTLLVLSHLFCLAASDFPSAPDRSFKIWWSLWRASIFAVSPIFQIFQTFFSTPRSEQKAFVIDSLSWNSEQKVCGKRKKNLQKLSRWLFFSFPFPGGNYPLPRTNEAQTPDVQLAHRPLNKIM